MTKRKIKYQPPFYLDSLEHIWICTGSEVPEFWRVLRKCILLFRIAHIGPGVNEHGLKLKKAVLSLCFYTEYNSRCQAWSIMWRNVLYVHTSRVWFTWKSSFNLIFIWFANHFSVWLPLSWIESSSNFQSVTPRTTWSQKNNPNSFSISRT